MGAAVFAIRSLDWKTGLTVFMKCCARGNMGFIIPEPLWGTPTQPSPDWYEDDEDDD